MDEPTVGMNTDETKLMMTLIEKIQKDNITILLIEHDMRVVMNLSNTITVINFGKEIAEGKPEEIQNDKNVHEAYLGDDTDVT